MASLPMDPPPMSLDGGDIAGIVGGAVTLLGAIGGGIRWALASKSKREQWIEQRIQQHVSKIETRLAVAERRADHLGFAFQLVAAELARLDPGSDILRRAQALIASMEGAFGPVPRNLPPEQADLMDELHAKTGGGWE